MRKNNPFWKERIYPVIYTADIFIYMAFTIWKLISSLEEVELSPFCHFTLKLH